MPPLPLCCSGLGPRLRKGWAMQPRPTSEGGFWAVKEPECGVSRGLWKMLQVTKRAFKNYVWNNKTKERGDVRETKLLSCCLACIFSAMEMTSLIGKGRIEVKEESRWGRDKRLWCPQMRWSPKAQEDRGSLRLRPSNQHTTLEKCWHHQERQENCR